MVSFRFNDIKRIIVNQQGDPLPELRPQFIILTIHGSEEGMGYVHINIGRQEALVDSRYPEGVFRMAVVDDRCIDVIIGYESPPSGLLIFCKGIHVFIIPIKLETDRIQGFNFRMGSDETLAEFGWSCYRPPNIEISGTFNQEPFYMKWSGFTLPIPFSNAFNGESIPGMAFIADKWHSFWFMLSRGCHQIIFIFAEGFLCNHSPILKVAEIVILTYKFLDKIPP